MGEELDLKDIIEAQKQILAVLCKLESEDTDRPPTFGERAADCITDFVGSWKFIISQGFLLVIYIFSNAHLLTNYNLSFDPYPFILLNLLLSFQAAFTAPLILISQNRSSQRDRKRALDSYSAIIHVEEMMKTLHEIIQRKKNGQ